MKLSICWAQMVKNPPAMQVTQVQPLGWEDALEKETATNSSILAWIIPWTEEPCGLQTTGSQRVGHDSDITHPFAALHSILWACVGSCFSVTKLCLVLYDPMDCSMPGFPVLDHLPEFAQTHVHWVSDAMQPSPSESPLSPALTLGLSPV